MLKDLLKVLLKAHQMFLQTPKEPRLPSENVLAITSGEMHKLDFNHNFLKPLHTSTFP